MRRALAIAILLIVVACSKTSAPPSERILGAWTDTSAPEGAQTTPASIEFFRDGTALLSWRYRVSGEDGVAKHQLHWTFVEPGRMKYEDRKGRLNNAGASAIWIDAVRIAGDEMTVEGEGPLRGVYRRGS